MKNVIRFSLILFLISFSFSSAISAESLLSTLSDKDDYSISKKSLEDTINDSIA